ncbi:hypothetical protein [Mycolicibacterium sp.]|uniref:hypothetical protein n=1 Tax=Mycolicibacterium sp. TaxID=2320850 RepID=UPI001A336300|nr:hypothetical protein [Mycolicibacterium sp.]MBJ7339779.1 hypothetical protein [Mycolicibacterium sp.]
MPPNWEEKLSPLALFGLLVAIAGIVYFAAQTVVSAARGSTPAALTAGGLAAFSLGFVGAIWSTFFLSARQCAGSSRAGTVVRIHPVIAWCCGVALVGGLVGSFCYLFFVSRGLASLPFATPGGERVNRYLMITLLVLTVTGLVALLRSREPGYLRMGVDGIEHANMFRSRRARWEDILAVTDKPDKRARNPIVFVVKDAKQVVVPNADRYGSSGAALYWMARYYWKHPEARDELTDGRALERLRDEKFDQS